MIEEGGGSLPEGATTLSPRRVKFDDSAFRRELTVECADELSGEVLGDATATVEAEESRKPFPFGSWRADARGQIVLDDPSRRLDGLHLLIRAAGHVPAALDLSSLADGTFAERSVVKLKRD